jgi:uncharacterized membrane protein
MSSANPSNRDAFVIALREGLRGLPAETIADLARDYETHIQDGIRRGRSEAEIVEALGDPERLARELRAEIRVKRWHDTHSPSAAVGVLTGFVGFATVGLIAPVLAVVAAVLAAFFATAVGVLCAGALLLISPWLGAIAGGSLGEQLRLFVMQSGEGALALMGVSLISGSVAAGAGVILLGVGIVHAFVWYGRLHYKLLRPKGRGGLETQSTKLTVVGI